MAKPEEVVKKEIKEYIDKVGGLYNSWYVGIAEDPRERLFEEHNVDKDEDFWIYRECEDSDAARSVEDYFINVLGTDGETGGGDENTVYVYAYKKTPHSEE